MSNLIVLIVISICLLYVQALASQDDLRRAVLARIPNTNPHQYYFLFLDSETESETESPLTEETMNEVKRSISDEQRILLSAKSAKRRMYARIGKRQYPHARVGR